MIRRKAGWFLSCRHPFCATLSGSSAGLGTLLLLKGIPLLGLAQPRYESRRLNWSRSKTHLPPAWFSLRGDRGHPRLCLIEAFGRANQATVAHHDSGSLDYLGASRQLQRFEWHGSHLGGREVHYCACCRRMCSGVARLWSLRLGSSCPVMTMTTTLMRRTRWPGG